MITASLIVLSLLAADPTEIGYVQDTRVPQRFTYPAGTPMSTWNNTFPHIVSIRGPRQPSLGCNKDATQITIHTLGRDFIILETADKTQQYADGTWAFVANDGTIHGTDREPKAFFEDHKGNERIGGWVQADDYVTWDFPATRWGRYSVELTYSLADGETEFEIDYGGVKANGKIDSTGTWYKYVTVPVGPVSIETAGKKTVTFRVLTKTGAAALNLKAIMLRPTFEGTDEPLTPGEDGGVTLHAHDALVDGVTLRYEPKPEKNCLGFWTNPNDRARWIFNAAEGEYDVEVHQGCGKGHGGSEVKVDVGDQSHTFTVEDTGHFQTFKPRVVGRVSLRGDAPHELTIIPLKKAKGAVMDVQKVRLIPVQKESRDRAIREIENRQ